LRTQFLRLQHARIHARNMPPFSGQSESFIGSSPHPYPRRRNPTLERLLIAKCGMRRGFLKNHHRGLLPLTRRRVSAILLVRNTAWTLRCCAAL
jgi:hypothetical protein